MLRVDVSRFRDAPVAGMLRGMLRLINVGLIYRSLKQQNISNKPSLIVMALKLSPIDATPG